MLTRIIWEGNKATMDGTFVRSRDMQPVAVGAYSKDGYEVLFNDGRIETHPNAANALMMLNRNTEL